MLSISYFGVDMSRAANAGQTKTFNSYSGDMSTYQKRTDSMIAADEWLKHNNAKQLTADDNSGNVSAFNGRQYKRKTGYKNYGRG